MLFIGRNHEDECTKTVVKAGFITHICVGYVEHNLGNVGYVVSRFRLASASFRNERLRGRIVSRAVRF